MSRFRRLTVALATTAMLSTALVGCQRTQPRPNTTTEATKDAGDKGHALTKPVVATSATLAVRSDAKPLADQTRKGLAWLAQHQLDNGGWGQGDESPQMGKSMATMRDKANVADTSMAVLALMRAGNRATEGEYKDAVRKGIEYIEREVEASDDDSLYVTATRGTRVQGKIGTYVDTFTALMVLTEAKGTMGDAAANQRLERALAKVMAKIEKNQRTDGTWGNQGWAPVLTQSLAAKGLNRAAQSGEDVDDAVLERVDTQARQQFDKTTGSFSAGGSAGIDLYAGAANASAMKESASTWKARKKSLRRKAAAADTAPAEREEAQRKLQIAEASERDSKSADQALVARLADPAFIRGFGNNGGEEFLSYMLMSETLMVEGGDDWQKWDKQITALIHGVQNGDGSWTGHHCITGRTFCTAAALLVLMADRAPVATASAIAG